MSDRLELTEAERIEFARRTNLALSVVPSLIRLMVQRDELHDRLRQLESKSRSGWLGTVFIVGGAIHFLQFGNEWKFGVGAWVMLMAVLFWYGTRLDRDRVSNDLRECQHRIEDRQTTWVAVGGNARNLWELKKIEFPGEQIEWDLADEALQSWWEEQIEDFYIGACDVEKGMALAKQRREGVANAKAFRAQLQATRPTA